MSNEMGTSTEELIHPLPSNTGFDEDGSITPMTITRTNTLFASTLLESSPEVQSHSIRLFLDLIHKPDFDKSALTLHTPKKVLAYLAHVRQLRASKRSDVPPATRQFPFSVITNIIDIVESERLLHFSVIQDVPDPVASTLSNLSLVHRSWTWSAQKAIGRRLIFNLTLANISLYSLVRRVVTSPLFGAWTHSVYIYQDFVTTMNWRGEPGAENVELLAALFERLPRIRLLRLPNDVMDPLTSTLVPYLKALTILRCLILPDSAIYNFRMKGRLVDTLHVASHLPRLVCLEVGRWGYDRHTHIPHEGSGEQYFARKFEQLMAERPPSNLEEISLFISSETPLNAVSWLFGPYKNTSSSTIRLGKAHLTFRIADAANPDHVQIDIPGHPAIMEYVTAISPAQSLKRITNLSLSFARESSIPESAILPFLEASVQLRTLSIYHGHNVAVISIIRALPSTLEEFTYKLDLPHEQLITFDGDVSREITAASFRATHQILRSISLSITEEFNISLVPTPTTNPYPLHWESREEQRQAIKALPVPTIAYIRQACESAHIRLGYSYGRSAASVGQLYTSSFARYASYAYRRPEMSCVSSPAVAVPYLFIEQISERTQYELL
jgi:hypothetical protein